jgi:hypothetical protein
MRRRSNATAARGLETLAESSTASNGELDPSAAKLSQRAFLKALGAVGLVAIGQAALRPDAAEADYDPGSGQDTVNTNLLIQGNVVVGPSLGAPVGGLTVSPTASGTTTVAGLVNTPNLTISGAAVPTVTGIFSQPIIVANAAVTSAIGLFVDTSQVSVGTGSIANNYGIYVNGPTAGAQRWALFSAGGSNYFAGNVGLGVPSPAWTLDVARTFTDTAPTYEYMANYEATLNPSGVKIGNFYALQSNINLVGAGGNFGMVQFSGGIFTVTNTTTGTITLGSPQALTAYFYHASTGTLTLGQGLEVYVHNSSTGHIVNGAAITATFEPAGAGTWDTFTAFQVNRNYTINPVTTVIGYSAASTQMYNSNNGTDSIGGYTSIGFRSSVANQGGNTSGTNYNVGFYVVDGGSGAPATGGTGTVYNYGLWIQAMPHGNGVGGSASTNNFGIRIQGNGGTGPNANNWAFRSDSTAQSVFLGPLAVGGSGSVTGPSFFQVTPTAKVATAASATWDGLSVLPATLTLTGGTHVTTTKGVNLVTVNAPTVTDTTAVVVDLAATLAITGPPAATGLVTLTNPYAFWVQAGTTRLGGNLSLDDGANLALGGTRGTQIGTAGGAAGQKLGFFGAAPVTQPLLATGVGHSVDDVIAALQLLGLTRQA